MAVYHDRNLIINYIPKSMTDAQLMKLFSSVGKVKTCRIIRDRNNGSSFGFGFCEYNDSEAAHKAIACFNGYQLAEKVLKVSLARLQGQLSYSSNLYVENFPLHLTEDDIIKEFGRFGRVIQCRVLRDFLTDFSRGSAYVLFENAEDAELAKRAFDGKSWPNSPDSQVMSIKFANPPYRQPSTKSHKHDISRRTTENQNRSQIKHHKDPITVNGVNQNKSSPPEVHIPSGFPPLIPNVEHTVPGSLLQSSLPVQQLQTPLGFIWTTDYSNPDSLHSAPTMNITPTYVAPYYYNTQPLPNFWAPVQQHGLAQIPVNGIYSNPLENYGNMMHGCPIFTNVPNSINSLIDQFKNYASVKSSHATQKQTSNIPVNRFKSSKSDKSDATSVYIYNIGNMTEAQLYILFSYFGPVTNVTIPKDYETNTPRNFGFITFSNHQSAQNAIEAMNGLVLSGRQLQVSFRKHKTTQFRVGNFAPQTTEKFNSYQINEIQDSGCHSPHLSNDKPDTSTTSPDNNLSTSEAVKESEGSEMENKTFKSPVLNPEVSV